MYLCFISTFAFTVFVFSLTPKYYTPEKRKLRGTMFLVLGVSTAIPIFHCIFFGDYIKGFNNQPHFFYWVLGGIFYVFGGLFYVLRIPEKYFPLTFDYCFYSHNILHIFVLTGFILHYFGSLDSYYYRLNNKCPI